MRKPPAKTVKVRTARKEGWDLGKKFLPISGAKYLVFGLIRWVFV
jgi:hypothetical protein